MVTAADWDGLQPGILHPVDRAMLDGAPAELLDCDHSNYVFAEVTGLEANDAGLGCGVPTGRHAPYSIDR